MLTTLNDAAIRSTLRRTLHAQASRVASAIVIEEFSIARGSTRADMALVNGHLAGYEIKSDRDTLARLPTQMRCFNAVFDRMTLVVGWRHATAALKLVPEWWGVRLAEQGPRGAVFLSPIRDPANNPEQVARSISSLLWRDEVLALLRAIGAAEEIGGMTRRALCDCLAESVSARELKHGVREALKQRRVVRPGGRLA